MTTEVIRKGRKLALSTTETAGAIDTGSVVLMNAFEARAAADEIKGRLGNLRQIVHEFDTREGWRALGYDSFREWALKEVDQASIRHVYRLAAAAEAEANLGVTVGRTPESHLRPLAALEADQQREAWELAGQLAGDGQRQATHVAAAVQAVGDFEPLTEEELRELSALGGWESDGQSPEPGKVRLQLCRGQHWGQRETRSPGGWRYELTQLREEAERKAAKRAADQRQQELIARAAAAGLDMAVTGKKIIFRLLDGTPYGGAKNLDDAESRIKMREGANAKRAANRAQQHPDCARCKQHNSVLFGKICQGCYHLYQAGQWGNESGDARFHLEEARKHARGIDDPAVAAGLLAEIADIESTWAAAVTTPAPAAPEPVAPEPVAPEPDDDHAAGVMRQHAESTLAGLLQRVTPSELRLLHCLVVGNTEIWLADDEGTAEELWRDGQALIGEFGANDLRWIETGVSE